MHSTGAGRSSGEGIGAGCLLASLAGTTTIGTATITEPAVVEVCYGCIRKLCVNDENKRTFGGSAAAIIAGMNEHSEGEATLQEMACLAIEAIAEGENKEFASMLVDAGVKEAVEQARESIVNERNKTYPDRALMALE